MATYKNIAILGGGNIGLSIAKGLQKSKLIDPKSIYITRRNIPLIEDFKEQGFKVTSNNKEAVDNSEVIIVAVQPQQVNELIDDIKESLTPEKHIVVSVVSGAGIKAIKNRIGKDVEVIRAMPNTAISIQESMTCIAAETKTSLGLKATENIFNQLGKTLIIDEELMIPATALAACGIAFFLRAIRAASQGGIEIGFHSEEALLMASQTAKGAATLILQGEAHPEKEVDKVTTPRGCTISGLNQMEHNGFSSAMIKGIVTSAEKCAQVYKIEE
jgi:pyrroline-5-carboxylate reductase